MNRNLFLRNALMALAVSLVPKILQPVVPELPEIIVKYFKMEVGDNGDCIWYTQETLDMFNAFEKKHNPFRLPILLP